MERNILKEKLKEIKKDNYVLCNEDGYFPLALEMLENIGSIDPEFRDNLIYATFFYWISGEKFTNEELEKLLDISLSNDHIFYKLYDKDEDGVFKRTFSALIVALIIGEHRKEGFLSKEKLYEVKDKLIEYMFKERDVRGYIDVKGWAHSAAHTADALDDLARCTSFNKNDLMDILNAIRFKVCIGYYVYIDEENERMVTAVESALDRKLISDAEIIDWLRTFLLKNSKESHMYNFHMKVNIKGFLRSLYFRLLENNDSKLIVQEILKVLKEL